ncbi:MAG: acetate kinase [Methylobacter sp.]|uniref:acetate/propionate family kinase n=1 Tax=Methylobacter sp. TaxID=2051955 RepID=UPI0027319C70|nr:acetate kinase [Methylobacter sp.]MDP1665981.1 acetate kinase [Methylobacter sp.]
MNRSVLTINSGSSSLKASLFSAKGTRCNFRYEHVHDQREAFDQLLHDLAGEMPELVGHRFVHGGENSDPAMKVDAAERSRLEQLIHLAPLHLPGNLLGLDLCLQHFNTPQIVCFDTAFHAAMPELAKRLPIPNELGLHRFGFHGLNYAYIAEILEGILGDVAYKKIIVAHLGSGASLCLMENLKSVDTTMGYTPAGGIPMGTRSGDLDPGVMLELAKRYDPEQLSDVVFHKMGLMALSAGESSEMNELLSSNSENAQFAVDYFCRQVRAAIGGFAAKAGGIDALVFTGGIGEHSAEVREKICDPLAFLGITLDNTANHSGMNEIGLAGHKPVLIVPADEEVMIRNLCLSVCP